MNPTNSQRLHFLDAIRAFAILMMLQGHFIHDLLATVYRDTGNVWYRVWEYCRGATAPTFFTITGFVFVYLLIKKEVYGFQNPRVKKGLKRGAKLLIWGYVLRISAYSLFQGTLNSSFFYVDVLHCIGMSIIVMILLFLLLCRADYKWFQWFLLVFGVVIFTIEPLVSSLQFDFLPIIMANYVTLDHGSIFILIPWFGYVCFGGFLAIVFYRYQQQANFYTFVIVSLVISGFLLIFYSSDILMLMYEVSGVTLLKSVAYNNYLFTRLGDVSLLFATFIAFRKLVSYPLFLKIGSNTLSVYLLHFVILYGSWFGLGLHQFLHQSLSPVFAIFGALLFIVFICLIVLIYQTYKIDVHHSLVTAIKQVWNKLLNFTRSTFTKFKSKKV